MGDRRSVSSNYDPNSQATKISIGARIDPQPEKMSGITKVNSAMPNGDDIQDTGRINQAEAPACKQTPCSQSSKLSIGETIDPLPKKSFGITMTTKSTVRNGDISKANVPAVDSVEPFEKRASVSQPSNNELGKRSKERIGSPPRMKKFPSSHTQKAHLYDEGAAEDKAGITGNELTDALRLKLLEILGTVPKCQPSGAQVSEIGARNTQLDQDKESKDNKFSNPKRNSDTIETDSENLANAIRRPVTRYFTRKRAPAKAGSKKTKLSSSSSYKRKHHGTIFNFEQGRRENLGTPVKLNSVTKKQRKSLEKPTFTDHRKILSPGTNGNIKVRKGSLSKETAKPSKNLPAKNLAYEKTSDVDCVVHFRSDAANDQKLPQTTAEGVKFAFPLVDEATLVQRVKRTCETSLSPVKNPRMEKTSWFSKERETNLDGALNFSSCLTNHKKLNGKSDVIEPGKIDSGAAKGAEVQRGVSRSEKRVPAKSVHDKQTLFFSNTRGSIDGCSPRRTSQTEQQYSIPEREACKWQETEKENQEHTAGNPTLSDNADREKFSGNQSKKSTYELADDFQSPTFGFKTPNSSPETGVMPQIGQASREKTRFTLRNIHSFKTPRIADNSSSVESDFSEKLKKLKDYSNRKVVSANLDNGSEDSLSESPSDERDVNSSEEYSPHLKAGIAGSDCFQELSGQYQEDGLGRAVMLFSLALQNFEGKLKSAVRKKASDILISTSEDIQLELQKAERHIQTDVEKLSSLNRSQRKRLETKLQEQKEHMKSLYEKYKAEINHHLEDSRNTFEVLDTHQSELEGTLKKQKTSHQKLIAQLEGEVESRLDDAQRRIICVNESAKSKMVELKRAIAACFKDTIAD